MAPRSRAAGGIVNRAAGMLTCGQDEEADVSDRAIRLMTVEEFLVWQTEQDRLYELVVGLPLAMAGAKLRHDRVMANAIRTIGNQLRASNSPCDAFTGDVGALTPVRRVRRPDVGVLCPPFDEDATISDRPRLIVEVLSESTEHVDRLFKLGEYQSMASIDYIVMVDPARGSKSVFGPGMPQAFGRAVAARAGSDD